MLWLVLLIHHTHYGRWVYLVIHFSFTTIILFVLTIRLTTILDLRRIFLNNYRDAKKRTMILLWLVVLFCRGLPLLFFFFQAHRILGFRLEFIYDWRYDDGALLIILILWELFVIVIVILTIRMKQSAFIISWILIGRLWRSLIWIAVFFTWIKGIILVFVDNGAVTYLVLDIFRDDFIVVDLIFVF